MGLLRMFLPPFAPDYSGAASICYDFNSMIVIHDASGCTSNYTGFDEPRWYGSQKPVYCTRLRETDAALGNEEVVLKRIDRALKDIDPNFIALIGSPVPLLIGTDFNGLALDVEVRTQIPAIGISTSGTGTYQNGMAMAMVEILDRFLPEDFSKRPSTVNILGASPLDFTGNIIDSLASDLTKRGLKVIGVLSKDMTIEKLKDMRNASVNIAINRPGIIACQWMEDYYDIPWVAGFPIGEKMTDDLCASIKELEKGNSESFVMDWDLDSKQDPKGLIVHEPIIGLGLARALENQLAYRFKIVCPIDMEEKPPIDLVEDLIEEKDLFDQVNKDYKTIVGDPLILDMVGKESKARKIHLGHYAVSSYLSQETMWNDRSDEFLKNIRP